MHAMLWYPGIFDVKCISWYQAASVSLDRKTTWLRGYKSNPCTWLPHFTAGVFLAV
jgi:hypothetical protein